MTAFTFAVEPTCRFVGGAVTTFWSVVATARDGRRFRHDHAVSVKALVERAPESIRALRDRIAASGISPVGRAHWEEVAPVVGSKAHFARNPRG
jgi:hypothetical protein